MICKYIIQLPGGGELTIPANFGTIENNSEILSELESLDREADNFLDEVSGIIKEISTLTGGVIEENQLYNIIINNIDSPKNIIDTINDTIEKNSEYNNLSKAVKFYLINNPDSVEQIKEELSKPISQSYFKNKSLVGVFNITNLKSEHLKIQSIISENNASGIYSEGLAHLNRFMSYLRRNNIKSYEENNLFMTSNEYGLKSANIDNLGFFREGDINSLFLTLFKRVASTLDVDTLNKAINGNYTDSSQFFKNKADSNRIGNSDFEILLNSENKKDQTYINNLIDEVTTLLGGKNDLKNSIKNLIIDLDTSLFADEYYERKLRNEAFLKEEQQFTNDYKEFRLGKSFETSLSDLGRHYSESKKISSNNLYEDTVNNISIGEDLVKLQKPNGESELVLVSDIFNRVRGGQSVGVYIRGIYKTSTGKYEALKHEFKNGETIEYRKKEDTKLEYIPNRDVRANDRTITLKDSRLNQDIIKYLIREGDTTNKNLVVAGIYPEYVIALNKEEAIPVPYSKIKSVGFSKLLEFESFKDAQSPTISSVDLLSVGDYFEANNTRYVALAINKDSVTSYQIENGVATLVDIPKNDITSINLGLFEKLTEAETIRILDNAIVESPESTLSQFVDISKVRTGDYGIGYSDDKPIVFKVSDHNTNRGITDSAVIDYSTLDNVVFYTSRDISSKSSFSVIRANSLKIFPDIREEDLNLYTELKYIVPKDTNLKNLMLLPNNYANIGYYQDASIELLPDEEDATSTILNLLKRNKIIANKLYARKQNATSSKLILNTDGYQRIDNFSNLSTEAKDALNVLRPGIMFSVFTESSIDPKIFRIVENRGDFVLAQYNIINKASNIITIEKEFKVSDLLSSKESPDDEFHPNGSIARLFIPYGDKNYKTIYEAAENNIDVNQIRSKQSINKLVSNIENTFRPLNIKVEQNAEIFENGQRAKLFVNDLGEMSIILNTKLGDYSDLIHETLHIYLTLLRATNLDAYGKIMNVVLGLEESVPEALFDKEERFIKKVVTFSKGETDFLYNDLKTFMTELVSVVNSLVKNSTGENLDLDFGDIINNPIEFLNTSLSSLYKINNTENSHSLYNLGLLKVEPMFREWVKNNDINLIC